MNSPSEPGATPGDLTLSAADQMAIEMYRVAAERIEGLIGDMRNIVDELRHEVKRVTSQ